MPSWVNEFGIEIDWPPKGAALSANPCKPLSLFEQCFAESAGDINVALSAYAILKDLDSSDNASVAGQMRGLLHKLDQALVKSKSKDIALSFLLQR